MTDIATSKVTDLAVKRALAAFTAAPEASMADAMRAAIEEALPFLTPVAATLPSDTSARRTIESLELGTPEYRWNVVSDCGVVKVYSSRDGCLLAVTPARAREIGNDFHEGMVGAAESVERAIRGGPR